MSKVQKRDIPIAICFITGIIVLFAYYIRNDTLGTTASILTSWNVIVYAIASCLGAVTLYRYHISHIVKRTKGKWVFSIILVGVMTAFILVGLLTSPNSPVFIDMYNTINRPLTTGAMSLLAFYIVSSAYKSLRGKSWEGIVMLLVASFVMFGRIGLGAWLSPVFPAIKDWLMIVASKAAGRGLIIGISMGTIIFGIKTLIGYETGWLGRLQEED